MCFTLARIYCKTTDDRVRQMPLAWDNSEWLYKCCNSPSGNGFHIQHPTHFLRDPAAWRILNYIANANLPAEFAKVQKQALELCKDGSQLPLPLLLMTDITFIFFPRWIDGEGFLCRQLADEVGREIVLRVDGCSLSPLQIPNLNSLGAEPLPTQKMALPRPAIRQAAAASRDKNALQREMYTEEDSEHESSSVDDDDDDDTSESEFSESERVTRRQRQSKYSKRAAHRVSKYDSKSAKSRKLAASRRRVALLLSSRDRKSARRSGLRLR